ncbi:putative quinol monooxygenase [Krasilnikovia sp. MM14-A1004]|uniref:putative quinol monooxygenase n=1 Tax=Krasilnikovia sp. MM14-A1004 TaxID=3373541 RepID=UPI00399C8640
MSDQQPIVVLGHQWARATVGADLAALNADLAAALTDADMPDRGLLAYQPLRNVADPDRFCVYWLWRDPQDRDATWADPPEALQRFWRLARPLWREEPAVTRYVWSPEPVRDLCPPDSHVVLSTGAPPPAAGGSAERWLLPEPGVDGDAVRIDVISPATTAPAAHRWALLSR